ncbi:uncharacterized protein NEMAJ01_0702 [Nematocida major]|uniref:uncharacterized protein n=1 Tax=Nematocida major TaxID=1912982 RepID=UPI002007D6CD|nr:uncharacterized protein NEMAJ01_0702 [Nematocida major]KAH9385806.1 hypothetical protein NEMAJ01_0702 [Nematocida major]
MDTVIVAFETPSVLSLKSLSELSDALPFPLRIFPMQIQNGKIAKRWALTGTRPNSTFTQKEEKSTTLKEFISQLRKSPCTILVDFSDETITDLHFRISCRDSTISTYCKGLNLKVSKISSTCSGIFQASDTFFRRISISLVGIRMRNKNGKKVSIDIPVSLQGVNYTLPQQMTMIQSQPQGLPVCISTVTSKSLLLEKVLSKGALFFSGSISEVPDFKMEEIPTENLKDRGNERGELFLRVECSGAVILCTFFKEASKVTLLDSSLPCMKAFYVSEYLKHVQRKYTDELAVIVSVFSDVSERKDLDAVLMGEMQRIKTLQEEKRKKVLLGIKDLICTLKFPERDDKGFLLLSMKKIYHEILRMQKAEVVNAPKRDIYVIPEGVGPASSLHCLLKEREK